MSSIRCKDYCLEYNGCDCVTCIKANQNTDRMECICSILQNGDEGERRVIRMYKYNKEERCPEYEEDWIKVMYNKGESKR